MFFILLTTIIKGIFFLGLVFKAPLYFFFFFKSSIFFLKHEITLTSPYSEGYVLSGKKLGNNFLEIGLERKNEVATIKGVTTWS
jgi:hypothetical protein